MRTRTALLLGQTTALGLMMAFLVVPASALFLHAYGAGMLPWTYLVVAVAGALASAGVSRAGRRVALASLAGWLVTVYLVIVAACWLALVRWDATQATFVLVVLFPLAIPLGFVAVGSQVVRLFDVRELKAQFPRVVVGFPLGFAAGGLVSGLVGDALGAVEHLLLLALLCGLGMGGLVRLTAREYPAELLTRPDRTEQAPTGGTGQRPHARVLRDPLVAAVLGYQVLSGAVTQLLDYIVWERAAAAFPDPVALARFQGFYGSALNVASILFVGLLASWLLRTYGVRLGLTGNPALVLLACLVMVMVGQTAGIIGLGFLTMACLAQVADITTTDGLTRGSVAATYQAMPPESRLPAQALAEGAGTPVAIGLVGALLLLNQALDLDIRSSVWLVLVLSLVWLVLALFVHRSYGRHLADVLRLGSWDPHALRIEGDEALAVVRRLLESADPVDRVTGLEALADSGSDLLEGELVRALGDAAPSVRLCALTLAATGGPVGRRPHLREALVELLGPSADGVRAAAILTGEDPDRTAIARTLWTDALAGPDDVLADAAVAGATLTPHPSQLPHLVRAAGQASPPLGILEALAAHAEELGPTLAAEWSAAPEPSAGRRRALVVRAVAGAGRSEPRRWLLARLGEPGLSRDDVRLIVDGLRPGSWTRQPATVPASLLADRVEAEAWRVHSALVGLSHLRAAETAVPAGGQASELEIAASAFRDELDEARRHVEILFGATACPRGTAWFPDALTETDPARRATAIELAEATLGRRRGALVVAVLDPALDDRARLESMETAGRRAGALAADVLGLPAGFLADVAVDRVGSWDSAWLRASLLRCLPRLSREDAERAARVLAEDPDPAVAETAAWVLSR